MELHVLNHPLVEHKLTVLRDKNTPSSTFRELVSELVMLEAYEATRNLSVVAAPIETPVAPMTGKKLASPRPIIVPVLRAGLGMLDGMTRLIPTAEVGFLGMKRDEEHIDPSIDFKVVVCAVDERLNDKCYIVPGLGDAGDRLYGVID
jgi:uracil phosphoribosyltransferase